MTGPTPLDPTLYARVKAEAKKRFQRWPSAYGSAWLSKTYRARGGKYRPSSKKTSPSRQGVGRWMKEEWIQVLPALESPPRFLPCGSAMGRGKACRPKTRVHSRTPPTLSEVVRAHGKHKVRSLARRKSRDMNGRADWKHGRFTPSSTTPRRPRSRRGRLPRERP